MHNELLTKSAGFLKEFCTFCKFMDNTRRTKQLGCRNGVLKNLCIFVTVFLRFAGT